MRDDHRDRNASTPNDAARHDGSDDQHDLPSGLNADDAFDAERGLTWGALGRLVDLFDSLLDDARRGAPRSPPDERIVAEHAAFCARLYAMTPDEVRAERDRRSLLRERETASRRWLSTSQPLDAEKHASPERADEPCAAPDSTGVPSAHQRAATIFAALLADDSDVPPPTPSEEREVAEIIERLRSMEREVLIERSVQLCRALDVPSTPDERREIAESIDYHCSLDDETLAKRALRLRRVLGAFPSPDEIREAERLAASIDGLRLMTSLGTDWRPHDRGRS